ncbi:MAG TPA: response regulator [Rhodocyclaceae bacterium]
MHPLLIRQLRLNLGTAEAAPLREAASELVALIGQMYGDGDGRAEAIARVETLLGQVGAAYEQNDRDTSLLRRSLELTSEELLEANERLRSELAARSRALDTLQTALSDLLESSGFHSNPYTGDDVEQLAAELAGLAGERKRAQEALHNINRELERRVAQRTLQLEAASRAKSDFLATMSHEIRTPLNTVIGMAHLALRTGLNPKQHGYLEHIHDAGQHLLGLIDTILDFSKIEAGKLDVEKVDMEIAQVVNSVSNLLASKAADKGLRFLVDIDPRLAQPLYGDPLRLSQVLINFISNAIKFTQQGEITIRAKLAADQDNCCLVRFEVQDTGIGMSAVEKERIFLAFQQADNSITRKYGGSGLGLAISRQLAALMGGEIGVESQPGLGSTFWFTARLGKDPAALAALEQQCGSSCVCWLTDPPQAVELPLPTAPWHPPPPAAAAPAPLATPAALQGARILLADDHPLNQQVASEILEAAGAYVCSVGTGREALDRLQQERFDCVLMDVQMPEMDGLTATRRIRADPALAGTRVIAMTANAWNEDRGHCIEAGMDDFISKPIQPEQLYATLARWLAPQPAPMTAAAAVPAEHTDATVDFSGDPAIIDLAVPAKTLKNDPGKVQRVALKFLNSTRDDLPRIEAALENRDLAMLRSLGHRIKSPARAMGASGLADLCQALEHLNGDDAAERARPIVGQLRPLLEQIAARIEGNPLLAPRGSSP